MNTTHKTQRALSMKQIDKAVEIAFYSCSQGLQFNVMDLGKIHAAGVTAYRAGEDVKAAVLKACQQYGMSTN